MQHLTRDLTAQEWAVVTKHAHRVKAINSPDIGNDCSIARSVWQQLLPNPPAISPQGRFFPLLPNLAILAYCYDPRDDLALSSLPSLAGPFLQELRLTEWPGRRLISTAQAAFTSFLLQVPVLYPRLRTIKIFGFAHKDLGPLTLIPTHIFEQMAYLRYLTVSYTLTTQVLSRLTSLRALNMPVHPSLETSLSRSPKIVFPELHKLHLSGHHLGDTLPFMRCIHLPSLKRISFGARFPFSAVSQVEEMILLVSRFKTLREIVLSSAPDTRTDLPVFIILPKTTFNPLLSLGNVTEVSLRVALALDRDDETIEAMARAWPHLKRLELTQRVESPTKSLATLAALVPLITHCPHLVSLEIPLDAVVPEQFQLKDLRARSSDRKWRSFTIRYRESVPDIELAAKFLSDLLPTVHTVFKASSGKLRQTSQDFPESASWIELVFNVQSLGKAYDAQRAGCAL